MKTSMYARLLIVSLFFCSISALAQNPKLRAETMRQIGLLLQEKESRTPSQRKINSQLLQAVREQRGQKMAAGSTLLPVDVGTNARGYLKVDISAEVSDELLSKIESLGGKIIYPSWEYHTIRAEVKLSSVETIAGYAGVKFIEPAVHSSTGGKGLAAGTAAVKKIKPTLAQREARATAIIKKYLEDLNATQPYFFAGTVNSEGDRTHRADDVRNTFGYSGQGIKIGVISDSYNKLNAAAADVANGELPGPGNPVNTTPVTVVQDDPTGSDEGRAMMQIVHDIAPKAQLFFATGNISEAGMATNILALRNTYHCDIIVDDIFYFDEPYFQDGTLAAAVNTVTADGALYFSSAGNSGNFSKNTSGYFEGDFNDTGSPAFTGGSKTGTIHNFGTAGSPVSGDVILSTGKGYTLSWADKWGASANDYDLFLVSNSGTVKSSSTNIQSGTQNPYEQITTVPALVAGDKLVVFKTSSAAAVAFCINTIRGTLTVGTAGETHGHSSAVNAFSIGASPANGSFGTGSPTGPYPSVFSASNQIENFSSDGPRRLFFDPNGNPVSPGNFTFASNGYTSLQKPDFTAADGVTTTLPTSSGLNPFFGTSAAAPHAAAIAALLKSAKPSLTRAQIFTAFKSTALDIEGAGYDINSGNGIIQAYQAMVSVSPTALANISLGSITTSEGSFSNGNGYIDRGELGKFMIQLNNATSIAATGVIASLTTSTTGVTVTQATVNYGTIAAAGNATNTSTPFFFNVNFSVACGTVIKFILTVNFSGGASPQAFPITVTVGRQPGGNLSTTLGTPITSVTGMVSTTGTQTGRVNRANGAAVCGTSKAAPGLFTSVGSFLYDAYAFTNTGSTVQCVTVTMNSTNGTNLYTAAYLNAFVPSNPNTNFVGDLGTPGASVSYSFNVPAGSRFAVVVHDINTPSTNRPYTLNIAFSDCGTPPSCTPAVVSTATIADGAINTFYSQSFAATGGSGGYIFSVSGTLPTGLSFSGNFLSGIPTQSGSFPVTITATDASGCPSGTKNYTLLIGTNSSTTITATAGASQSAVINTAFATALQATVLGTNNAPTPGATVTFTAPASGAGGTFTGAATTATAVTNNSGVATAPTFTANGTTGSYAVTASVTGAVSNASFNLTNSTNCAISCPANIVVNNTAGQCGAIVNYAAPVTSGSCGVVSALPASGTFFPVGTTTVTATGSGGSTCSFTVKMVDVQAPVITCPTNITVGNTTDVCGAVVTFPAPTITDNCPGTTFVFNPASGSTFSLGNTTVTLTATDASGNTSSCTFTVTVNDTQFPVLTCPANVTVNTAAGQCGATVTYAAPTATDNCTGVTVVSSPASGSFFAKGTTTVTSTATDGAGNVSTCTFTVTVKDAQPPTITCPADITVPNDPNQCTAIVTFAAPVISDNCPGATVVTSPVAGSAFLIGVNTVTATATDASGNTTTCTFKITVTDTRPPVIVTQPSNTTVCPTLNAGFSVTASATLSYQWQVNTGNGFTDIAGATSAALTLNAVTVSMSGYQYRVKVTGVCTSVFSNAATLTVYPLPTISLAVSPLSNLKPGEQTTITATTTPAAGGSLAWMKDGIALSGAITRTVVVTIDGLGTYRSTFTDPNGCIVTSNDIVIGATPADNIFIYPNPNKGQFQLRYYTPVNTTLQVIIHDTKGAKVYNKQMVTAGPYTRIDVDAALIKSGLYIVEVRGSDGKMLDSKKVFIMP